MTELAALHAVGALDGGDLREFEAALAAAGAAVPVEVRHMNDTAAAFAFGRPTTLPAGLKAKVMKRILRSAVPSGPGMPASLPFFFVTRDEGQWVALPVPGVRMKELASDSRRGSTVRLYELAPGARFPNHHHTGPEECFVLSGDFHVEGRVLRGGDFHHAEEHTDHAESYTDGGCTLLVMATATDYEG